MPENCSRLLKLGGEMGWEKPEGAMGRVRPGPCRAVAQAVHTHPAGGWGIRAGSYKWGWGA